MKAVIVNGGNRAASRLTGIEKEIGKQLEVLGIPYEVIRVFELPAEDLITANYNSELLVEKVQAVKEADILFFLTPIYKGSFSGILKTFLDILPQKSLRDKTVFPIAIGGSFAHLLALEYSLKPVLSILGATLLSSAIFVLDEQVEKQEGGQFRLSEEAKTRIQSALEQMIPKQSLSEWDHKVVLRAKA